MCTLVQSLPSIVILICTISFDIVSAVRGGVLCLGNLPTTLKNKGNPRVHHPNHNDGRHKTDLQRSKKQNESTPKTTNKKSSTAHDVPSKIFRVHKQQAWEKTLNKKKGGTSHWKDRLNPCVNGAEVAPYHSSNGPTFPFGIVMYKCIILFVMTCRVLVGVALKMCLQGGLSPPLCPA